MIKISYSASALKTDTIAHLELMNMPAFVLAPIAGILMGGTTTIIAIILYLI